MKSVLRAGGARVIIFPVTAVATLLTARIVITSSSPEIYGIVMLIASLFLFMPFADLGTGTAIINALSDSSSSREKALATISQVVRWLLLSATILVVLSVLALVTQFWSSILGTPEPLRQQVNLAATLAISVFALSVPFSVGQRILLGLQRNDISVFLSATTSLVTLAFTWFFSVWGTEPLLYAVAIPLGVFFSQVLQYVIGCRILKKPLTFPLKTSLTDLSSRHILSQAGPMLIILVLTPLMLQGHRVILSQNAPGQVLAEYSLGMQLYTPIWGFITAGSMALWPLFAQHRNDPKAQQKLFGRALLLFSGIGAFGALGLVLLGAPLSSLISDGKIFLSLPVLLSFGALLLTQATQQVPGMFLTTARGLRIQAILTIFACLSSLGLSLLLVRNLGAAAPGLATSIGLGSFLLFPSIFFALKNTQKREKKSAEEQKTLRG